MYKPILNEIKSTINLIVAFLNSQNFSGEPSMFKNKNFDNFKELFVSMDVFRHIYRF